MDDACRSGAITFDRLVPEQKLWRVAFSSVKRNPFPLIVDIGPPAWHFVWPPQFLFIQVSQRPLSPASTSAYDVGISIPVQSLTPVKSMVASWQSLLTSLFVISAGFPTPPLIHSGQRHPTLRLLTTFCFWTVAFARYYEAFHRFERSVKYRSEVHRQLACRPLLSLLFSLGSTEPPLLANSLSEAAFWS
jgi:hypothetical protein